MKYYYFQYCFVKNTAGNKVHISERGWCGWQLRLSHHRSVLADMNEAPKSAPQHVPTVGGNFTKQNVKHKKIYSDEAISNCPK